MFTDSPTDDLDSGNNIPLDFDQALLERDSLGKALSKPLHRWKIEVSNTETELTLKWTAEERGY